MSDQPDTVQHEGEGLSSKSLKIDEHGAITEWDPFDTAWRRFEGNFWMTVDGGAAKGVFLTEGEPTPSRSNRSAWRWLYPTGALELFGPLKDALAPLADPDQPVRVRLELRAVRVEEESDGEG